MNETQPTQADTPHKRVETIVGSIGLYAFGTFVLGSVFGAPWPAAVAVCGLSFMGVGVAYFMLRRT